MTYFIHSPWRLLLGGLSLAWMIIIAVAQFSVAQQNYPLQNSVIQHDTGCAYYVGPLSERPWAWPITRFRADSTSGAQVSRLSLLENGKIIGKPHALHDTIRASGLGNYSHWGDLLYFSAPDCSDPRANGRRYEIVMQQSLSPWAYVSVLIATMTLSVVLATYLLASPRFSQLFRQINKFSSELLVPANTSRRQVLWLVAFFILMIFAWGFHVFTWGSGKTVNGLAVGGFYQVSDSMAYWLCSNNLLDVGNFGHPTVTGEWCQRRATYPSFLSGVAWIAQRNIFATLLVQALIVSVAIYVVARRSAHLAGVIGAGLCTLLLFRYATVDLFVLLGSAAILYAFFPISAVLGKGLTTLFLMGCAITLFIVFYARSSGIGEALIARLAKRWLQRWPLQPEIFLAELRGEFRRLLGSWPSIGLVLLAALILCVDYGAIAALLQAFDLSLPVEAPLLLWVFLAAGSALPSAPGYVGVYQVAAVWALSFFAVSAPTAVAIATVLQITTLAVAIVMAGPGAMGMFKRMLLQKNPA